MSELTSIKDLGDDDRILALTQTIVGLGVSLDHPDLKQALSEILSADRLHQKYRAEIADLISPLLENQSIDIEVLASALAKALVPLLPSDKSPQNGLQIESTRSTEYRAINDSDLAKIEALFRTEIAEINNVDLDGLAQVMSNTAVLPLIPEWQKLLGSTLIGLMIGASLIGATVNFWLLPLSIQNQRLQDADTLKYLESKEGQMFRQIVRLNSGYLDSGKCVKDAKSRDLFLIKNKQRIENVCVVIMP